jgi:monoamine oxidase
VRIAGAGFEHVADAAVIAVPAAQAASLRYEPALPAPKRAALAGVRYGVAAKLAVRLARPAPPSATLDVAARFWCYTQLGPDGAPSPVVTCFAGTAAAVAALGVDDGPERWLAALRRLRPDLGLTGDALLTTWAPGLLEPGAYSARSHASPLRHADLAAPVGPLQFAGEHTAGPAHALMEGAIASGERAAAALLDAVAGRSR